MSDELFICKHLALFPMPDLEEAKYVIERRENPRAWVIVKVVAQLQQPDTEESWSDQE